MTTTTSTSRRSSSSAEAPARPSTTRRGVRICCSIAADGDFHRLEVPLDRLEARRRSIVDLPWTMLDQHHGVDVVRVATPGDGDGAAGDIAITHCDDAVLACWAADCAPIVIVGERREFAVVHAGWRGLAAGIVDVAVAALSDPIAGVVLGPTIGPCCYEFGEHDLARVAAGTHAEVDVITSTTSIGGVALDVAAAVEAACAHHDLALERLGGCPGCSFDGFSHRVRGDSKRHVVAAWRPGRGHR